MRGEGNEIIMIRRIKTTLRRQVWTGTSRVAARAAVKNPKNRVKNTARQREEHGANDRRAKLGGPDFLQNTYKIVLGNIIKYYSASEA